jgi:hypothetical protein
MPECPQEAVIKGVGKHQENSWTMFTSQIDFAFYHFQTFITTLILGTHAPKGGKVWF